MILTSTNGTNWIQIESPVTNTLEKIVNAADQFIAVGAGGTILTSPDGVSFTQQPSLVTNWLRDISAGPDAIVAVGDQSTILASSNSTEWRKAEVTNSSTARTNLFLSGVAYFKSNYYAGPLVSPNPLSWSNNISSAASAFVGDIAATDRGIARRDPNGFFQHSFDGRIWYTNRTVLGNFNLIVISNLLHVLGGANGLLFVDRNFQFTSMLQEAIPQISNIASFIYSLSSTPGGFFARSTGLSDQVRGTFYSPDSKAWRRRIESDPQEDTNDWAFATAPFARYSNGTLEVSSDRLTWQSISAWPSSSRGNRLRKAGALDEVIVAADSFNVWAVTNQVWNKLMSGTGPTNQVGGSAEYDLGPTPWITSLEVGASIAAVTTSWGELLISQDGLNWQTNQTPFMPLHECTITPRGIMVTSYRTIAEALFNATLDVPTQFGFTVGDRELQFTGLMAHFEIQTTTNLNASWKTLRSTSTNVYLPISTVGSVFFRAIMPP